jgi:PAS domain S-box-containing protein
MFDEIETANQRYRIVFELSPDAININRLSDGLYLDVNEGFTKLTGYTRSDVIGKTSTELRIWVNLDDRRRLLEHLNTERRVRNLQAQFRRKNGSVTTGIMSAEIIELNGENCILSVTRDIGELVQSKHALFESQVHYRHLVETVRAIPWVLDLSTWRFTYVGPQARDLLGYDIDDWYQVGFWENHIHPDDREWVLKYCRACTQSSGDHELEYRMIAIDNNVVWVLDNLIVVNNGSGPTHLQGFMFDITKSKQAEEIMKRKNRQLELLSTSCQQINSVLDSNMVVRTLIHTGIELLEASSGAAGLVENGKMVLQEYVTPKEHETINQSFEPGVGVAGWVLQTKQPYITNDTENDPHVLPEIRDKYQIYNCVNVPILDRTGKVVGCIEIHNSKHKRQFDQHDVGMLQGLAANVAVSLENAWAMHELEQVVNSQRRFTQRLQLLHDIDKAILTERKPSDIAAKAIHHIEKLVPCKRISVVLIDKTANRGRVLAVGGDSAEEIGPGSIVTLSDRFINKLGNNTKNILVDLSKQTDNTYFPSLETKIKQKGIQYVYHAPLVAHGNAFGVLNLGLEKYTKFTEEQLEIISEVSDSLATAIHHAQLDEEVQTYTQELETRVAERTAELEHINKEMETFSYSVSHDLRAPLRAISGFASALQEDVENISPLANEHAGRIIRAAKKMDQIIHDLLDLSKVNLVQLNYQQIDLAEIAQAVFAELRELDPKHNVVFKHPEKMPANGDYGLMKIALHNLLSNAWKYTQQTASPLIEFDTTNNGERDSQRVFYIKDNGIGFDAKYSDKLFVAFSRLHPESEFEGTGVGLATVQRIIQRHKGRIWAESQPGQGATFYFSLPGKLAD